MGGQMHVESKPGQGSNFSFTIRVKTSKQPDSASLGDHQSLLAGKRLLLVEDSEAYRQVLLNHLSVFALSVRVASSATEALSWINEAAQFDLALIEKDLPDRDGLTLMQKLRERAGLQLPAAILTTVEQLKLSGSYELADAIVYVTKPVKISQLQNALNALLGGEPFLPERTDSTLDRKLAERFPLTILLADDNVVNQKVALQIFRWMGFQPDVAANGVEILEAVHRKRYDIVFTDVHMPVMEGGGSGAPDLCRVFAH